MQNKITSIAISHKKIPLPLKIAQLIPVSRIVTVDKTYSISLWLLLLHVYTYEPLNIKVIAVVSTVSM